MPATTAELRRTPLHDTHVGAGARMVPFAGWEMPVQYEGIRAEHLAVRARAGLFDVSHMGEIETRGANATAFLCHLLTNDVQKIETGGAQYALLCREDGGVLDDLFTYRFPGEQRFLTVVNAANAELDFDWFARHAQGWEDVEVIDRSDDYAMLALQGPAAVAMLAPHLAGAELPRRFHFVDATVTGAPALVCRTGYTGEDGVELLLAPDDAARVWDALIGSGAAPAGLGARDTLRLEVCFPLHGNDITPERTPIEAGLGWACALDKEFVGAGRLRRQAERGTDERLAPFIFTGPGIPRPGCAVLVGGERIGVVTSGTLSPSLEVGIGMAYLRRDLATPGIEIQIDVRGKLREARVASKPLYSKE